jgi:Domain of unknown function (DUF5916)/Carbohydrate family 9 binding domain-like
MRRLLPLLCCLLFASIAAAAPVVRAVRLDHPVELDGRLEEPVWRQAESIPALVMSEPDQGVPARQRTVVRLAYDKDALYVGARLYDTAPDSIVARVARRDADVPSDEFAIMLDPFRDKRTGYFFGVNAAGTLQDGVFFNDTQGDDSWDGVWQARVQRDAEGWTAEMRIPFSQLRFRDAEQMVWGVNVQRKVTRYNEEDALVYTPRGESGRVSRFAELHGIDGVRSSQHLEIVRYITNKTEAVRFDTNDLSPYASNDPFRSGCKVRFSAGGDLRASLGSKLTLNATVNPDFGQVEIDPAVVNLSDVESFFMEKRPFFTEGVGVFRCGNNGANDYPGFNWPEPMFFYSRRIGRAPQGGTPSADFVDRPLGTHILGAAKITGQVAPGWNIGTVQALTQREEATLRTAGQDSRFGVEPLTWYGVWRGLHEMNDRRQGIGFMGTTTARFFDGASDPLRDQVNRDAAVGTFDGWTVLDEKRVWVLSGWASASRVSGTTTRITALQRRSNHYFQRPDRPDLGVDPNATSLTGWGSRLWLNKQQGRLMFNAALGAISPGFENNDLGFQFGGDIVNAHVMAGWQWQEPNAWRQYAYVLGAVAQSWDFGGNSTLSGTYLGGMLEQRNHWSWNASTFLLAPAYSPRATRGGPLMRTPLRAMTQLSFDTNSRRSWFWSLGMSPEFTQDGSWSMSVEPSFAWRPSPGLGFKGGPSYLRAHDETQWVDNLGTLATGSRFAQIEQTQWSMNLRMDYAATPNLSVQLFVQPLLSTLDFHDLKELARSRSDEFLPVQSGAIAGSTFASLRGNAVVRWEYAPGSSAYFVWTQERAHADGVSDFDVEHSFRVLSNAPVNNVFMVKVAHHFDL